MPSLTKEGEAGRVGLVGLLRSDGIYGAVPVKSSKEVFQLHPPSVFPMEMLPILL